MDIREKLVELLMQVSDNMCDDCGREPVGCAVVAIADHLIANGVTIQKWIPVSERLPQKGEMVLIYRRDPNTDIWYTSTDRLCLVRGEVFMWEGDYLFNGPDITHWMPYLQPPKE